MFIRHYRTKFERLKIIIFLLQKRVQRHSRCGYFDGQQCFSNVDTYVRGDEYMS